MSHPENEVPTAAAPTPPDQPSLPSWGIGTDSLAARLRQQRELVEQSAAASTPERQHPQG